MRDIHLLLELQNLCDQESEVKKRLRESAQSLQSLLAVHQVAEKQYLLLEKRIADLKSQLMVENLQLATLEGNIKKWNTELYTTHNANPKYLRDIESKIKENEASKNHSEDKVLELMSQLEEDENRFQQVQADFTDASEMFQLKKRAHEALEKESEVISQELERKKSELRIQIDQEWIEVFDRTFLTCQGKAVSVISKGTCQICRFLIPTSKLDQLYQHREELHFCDNCKRIIMVS